MKTSRRIAAIAVREARRFVAMASERAARTESMPNSRPTFRPLTEAETAALLGGELLAGLSGVRRHAS